MALPSHDANRPEPRPDAPVRPQRVAPKTAEPAAETAEANKAKTGKDKGKVSKSRTAPRVNLRGKGTAIIAGLGVGTIGFAALLYGVNSTAASTTEVYVTTSPLAANQMVTIDDFMIANLPTEAVPVGALTMDDLDNALYFAQVALPEGTPLTDAVFATKTRTNIALPAGMVTASVEVDPASAVGGKIQPGDYVNVFAVGASADGEQVARGILNHVLILDATIDPATLAKSASSKTVDASTLAGPNNPQVYGGVPTLYTVAVTNEQAATLALARDADLYLALTSPDDTAPLNVTVPASQVFGSGAVDATVVTPDPVIDETVTDEAVTEPTAPAADPTRAAN